MRLEEHIRLSRLLDIYGALLTARQRHVLNQYVNEDLSLFEISELHGISRQGVRDAIVKAESRLEEFEQRLCVLDKINSMNIALKNIADIADDLPKQKRAAIQKETAYIADCWNYTLED